MLNTLDYASLMTCETNKKRSTIDKVIMAGLIANILVLVILALMYFVSR